ncbi:hypothetical protein [Ruegeria sp.]|uniref:hypothetical protein n=1 Tax=Ruegeria sp. TaxID=1879320 RepID=UPI003C7E6674
MDVRTFSPFLSWLYRVASTALLFCDRFSAKTLFAAGLVCALGSSLNAKDLPAPEDLANTIWVTENGYSYVAVTTEGTVQSFEGANFAIEFLEAKHGVLVARVRWVSPEEKLGETQFLLFVPDGVGGFSFQAAGTPNVVGGAANGNIRTVGDGKALFTSFNLENGRAGSINTIVTKVDALPAKFEAKQ